MKKIILFFSLASIIILGCDGSKSILETEVMEKDQMEKEMKMKETHGIDPSNMNIEISPKQDFYSFANGGWEAKTTIPDDEARWGSFNELREKNDDMTLALVDKALMNKTINPNSDEGKVATFFNLAMDTDK